MISIYFGNPTDDQYMFLGNDWLSSVQSNLH